VKSEDWVQTQNALVHRSVIDWLQRVFAFTIDRDPGVVSAGVDVLHCRRNYCHWDLAVAVGTKGVGEASSFVGRVLPERDGTAVMPVLANSVCLGMRLHS
jgi:hypothetical protein